MRKASIAILVLAFVASGCASYVDVADCRSEARPADRNCERSREEIERAEMERYRWEHARETARKMEENVARDRPANDEARLQFTGG